MATSRNYAPQATPLIKPGDNPRAVWKDDNKWHINADEDVIFLNDTTDDSEIAELSGNVFPFDFAANKFKVPGKKPNQSGPGATFCRMKPNLAGTYKYVLNTRSSSGTPMSTPKEVTIP